MDPAGSWHESTCEMLGCIARPLSRKRREPSVGIGRGGEAAQGEDAAGRRKVLVRIGERHLRGFRTAEGVE